MSETLARTDTSPEAVERCAKWAEGNAAIFAVALLGRDSLHDDVVTTEKLRERHRLHNEQAAVLRALSAANARLERERDALRDEWEEIAAGITTEQPEVGALWPMVAEISGSLAAVRLHFKNEVVAHNATKAERAAAIAARVAAEGEMRRALRWVQRTHDACADPARPRQHVGEMLAGLLADPSFAALTPAPEAPKDGE